VVTIRTAGCDILGKKKSTFCKHNTFVFPNGSQNIEQLLSYTAFTDTYNRDGVFSARYALGL